MLAGVAALSFWLPDAIIHLVAGQKFGAAHVAIITLVSPTTFLIGYLCLERLATRRGYRPVAVAMLLGVWLLGGLFMTMVAAVTGGFAGPNRIGTIFMFLLLSLVPLYTWIMATYDGSLGALIIVTLGLLGFVAVRRYRSHAVSSS